MNPKLLNALQGTKVVPHYTPLGGGLDQESPLTQRKPGFVRSGHNYEALLNGGYGRIGGYERFSGQPKPSDATYSILAATITGVALLGDTLTGVTSGATGVIIALPGDSFVLTKVSGHFEAAESLRIGVTTIATATAVDNIDSATTALLRAQYRNLAADNYRADIAAVPGSGAILGVHLFNDVLYAFRNTADGTAAAMYASSASGWTPVTFEYQISYTAATGAATIVDGGTLTQGGVTATIRRVLVQSGSLSGGTAAGTLVIAAPAGGNFASGAATVGAGTLTLSGAQTAITLSPGGRFSFVIETFGGSITSKRLYGCDGVNKAFEFDGTTFVPIPTGMTTDAPTHIIAHKKHLFLAFAGSLQHSSIGAPYGWSAVTGAAELAMGDTITGFSALPGSQSSGAMVVFTRNRTSILYGSSAADWNLVPYRDELGAYAYTIQDVGFTVFLDDRGITEMQAVQSFGNFAHAALSDKARRLINSLRTRSSASCIARDKNQYRLFFSTGDAIYLTVAGNKVVGLMPQVFQHPVRCICSQEMNDGSEAMFFGGDDGVVYQLDKGTSFDGDAINASLDLVYDFQKSPRTRKRYRDLTVEITGTGYAAITFSYALGYANSAIAQAANSTVTPEISDALWDTGTWDTGTWDGATLLPSSFTIDGEAENIAFSFRTASDYFDSHTFTGLLTHYTPRKELRP